MSTNVLFTGAYTFPHPEAPDSRQFGMVACESPPNGAGVITMFLRHVDTGIAVSDDGTSLQLAIPEALARAMVPIIDRVLAKMDDLRKSTSQPPEKDRGDR